MTMWERKLPSLGLLLTIILASAISSCWAQKGSISGHIYRSDGTPITTEVRVLCWPVDPDIDITPWDLSPFLGVEVHGEFKIGGLPASRYALWARAADHTLFCERPIIVKVGRMLNTSQDLILVPGGSITGHIDGIQPEMIRFAPFKVWCHSVPEELSGLYYFEKYTVVAEDGTYLLKNVPPSRMMIDVNNGYGRDSHRAESAVLTVKSGEQTQKDFSIMSNK